MRKSQDRSAGANLKDCDAALAFTNEKPAGAIASAGFS